MALDPELKEIETELAALLKVHGCHLVSPAHLAFEARSYREETSYYDLELDAIVSEPFFHYVVAEEVAIFLVDGDPFSIYVFKCLPHDLITYVEGNIAANDVPGCQHYLVEVLGKHADLMLPPDLAYRWIDG